RRRYLGRAQIHGAAGTGRWGLRIRLSDGGRAAILVEKRGRGIRRGCVRQDALYARRRSPEKRLSPGGPAVDRGANSGAGVAFTSDRLEPGGPRTRGVRDGRLGSVSEQPGFHSPLSTGGPTDRLGAVALSGQGREFLPAHGAA